MSFLSAKIEKPEEALALAKKLSSEERKYYVVIQCRRSNGYYVEEGDCPFIRSWESVKARFENGKRKK